MNTRLPRAPLSLAPSDQVSDPYDFVVPPPAGKSAPVSSRVDIEMKGRISALLARQIFRYRNESDFVRAAIHFFMDEKIAPRMDKNWQSDLQRTVLEVESQQQIARNQDALKFCQDTRRNLMTCLDNEALDAAITIFENAIAHAERHSTAVFRRKVLDYLQNNIEFEKIRLEILRRQIDSPEAA